MSAAQVSGFVLVDKPAGWTSHDVVGRMRRVLGQRRVGHAGTLDPMATGVLILAVGRATRLLSLASDADKTYLATIRLGQTTITDDAEGEVVDSHGALGLHIDAVAQAAQTFVGTIDQRPSSVSAIKVAGRRAYDRVRAGEEVVLASRRIVVHEFVVLRSQTEGEFLDVDVSVRCGSGTYVRALARDLGAALQVDGTPVGGHLTALRRVESAGVAVSECQSIDDVTAHPTVIPPEGLVDRWCPVVTVPDAAPLTHGRAVKLPEGATLHAGRHAHAPATGDGGDEPADRPVAVVGSTGTMVALARVNRGMLEPLVVLLDPIATPPGGPTDPTGVEE